MIKSLVSITGVALVCAALLAGVRYQTAPHIRANREAATWAVAFQLAGGPFPTNNVTLPLANLRIGGTRLDTVSTPGYGGSIEMLVALDRGSIGGVKVTRHEETPGLGDFIEGEWMNQFEQMQPMEVDTISGATITSLAIKRALQSHLRTALAETAPEGPPG